MQAYTRRDRSRSPASRNSRRRRSDPEGNGRRPQAQRVLITGGAGFIGAHVARELLAHGYAVRILDSLHPQVHGSGDWPGYLPPGTERIRGDLNEPATLGPALEDVSSVVHLAARVGVGQSMYEIRSYVRSNNLGTASLLEALTDHDVRRLVVASSMSVYGEGAYRTGDGEPARPSRRTAAQLSAGEWNPAGADGRPLDPLPTPESKRPDLASVYALSKFDQERLCLLLGQAYGIPTVALRLFNVYGPYQALSNPYTGVLAIFASRLLNGNPPLIYEDGMQRRDFVHVRDVAHAFRLALEAPEANGRVINVGSGTSRTIASVAERMRDLMGVSVRPQITGRHRMGDIRHCFADISLARRTLGYRPQVDFEEGLAELVDWLAEQRPSDRVDEANRELEVRGLVG